MPERLKEISPAGARLKEIEGEPEDEFKRAMQEQLEIQRRQQVPDQGAILGYALATCTRGRVSLTSTSRTPAPRSACFPQSGKKPEAGFDAFTVVGFFKSGMSEYDSTHVYVPLEQLQKTRLLVGPDGKGAVNQIQIKVKPGTNLDRLADRLQLALERLHPMFFRVSTWEQKQGPLLGAVAIEQSILNILLFFIIAVAGFGILAIFSMIVVEKTRDIGVMKALGASTAGSAGSSSATGCCWAPSAAASAWPAACCSSATSTRSRNS